ncbi:MAG: hypothetical protein IH934_04815 [Nanoarchaeota archaeon]|nr:hypothetical protein [Nanoarchaeota archaeon]
MESKEENNNEELLKKSKKEIIKYFHYKIGNLRMWNVRYLNLITKKSFQIRNLHIRLKKISNSIEHILNHPYNTNEAYIGKKKKKK